jgi:hypothetical protein
MAPRNFDPISIQPTESDIITGQHQSTEDSTHEIITVKEYKPKIVWKNVLIFTYLHIAALYGLYLCQFAKYQTLIFGNFLTRFKNIYIY